MSNLESFLTGFFTKGTEILDERRQQADDYYAKQLERAQTVGAAKLSERKARVQAATQKANQLATQANVPPSVIRKAVEGGLAGVDQIEQIWSDATSKGIKTDRAFWEGVYGVAAAESETTGEDFNTTFSRIAGASIEDQASAQEEPSSDRMSWGEILTGRAYMPSAARKLENTEVAPGVSAADALAAEHYQEPTGGVMPNYEFLAGEEAAAAERDRLAKKERDEREDALKPATPADQDRVQRTIDEEAKRWYDENRFKMPGYDSDNPDERRAAEEEAKRQAEKAGIAKARTIYGSEQLSRILPYTDGIGVEEEEAAAEGEVQGPPVKDPATKEKPEGVRPAMLGPNGQKLVFSQVDSEGRIVYQDPATGKYTAYKKEKVMEHGYEASSGDTASAQQRIDRAITEIIKNRDNPSAAEKIYNEQLFIGNDERPPQVINHPKYGAVPLSGEEADAYIYDLGNGMEPIVIRKK